MVEIEAERLLAAGDDLRRQVLGLDHRAGGGDHRLLDDVLELAHVARPVVAAAAARGPRENVLAGMPRSTSLSRKWLTSSGMSSSRSRRGGSSIETTLSR